MAQLGRALRSGRRSRKFESCHLDHFGSEKCFSEPFSLPTAMQILRADDCFSSALALIIIPTKWNLEYSFIVLLLYCNNATYAKHKAYDKYSNGKYKQFFKQSYNAT